MPTFCRHNRLIQNCTICARELNVVDARPVVSSGAPRSTQPRERVARERSPRSGAASRTGRTGRDGRRGTGNAGLRVRRLARGADDGFNSPLLLGLRSSEDADALARELAFSAWRLELMRAVAAGDRPPAVPEIWSQIAGHGDAATAEGIEERTALAFRWVVEGPRGVGGADRAGEALAAYGSWVARAGSQVAAFTGEPGWTPERRFERIFERLGFGRLGRDTRFELLTLLGHLGVYQLRAGRLFLVGENEPTWAAKRALGIGDPLLLERRAVELAEACELELEALDLALRNWGAGARLDVGLPLDAVGDESVLERVRAALGL